MNELDQTPPFPLHPPPQIAGVAHARSRGAGGRRRHNDVLSATRLAARLQEAMQLPWRRRNGSKEIAEVIEIKQKQ